MGIAPADFPELLRSIPDTPEELHVRGRIESRDALAVVGSRRPTPYGRRMARTLAKGCAKAGIVVVSGLARGVDTEAHQAALEAGGATWAVLGSGLERIYPGENVKLAERIVSSGGALLSEFPPDAPPLRENFPRRNRIISGLSWGVIVVEGNMRSGALITARCALVQGREVFAVPGPADSEMSEGPLELIRQGAVLVRDIDDVLAELPMLAAPGAGEDDPSDGGRPGSGEDAALGADERGVVESLACGSLSLEELEDETGLPTPRLLRALTELESRGRILAVPGQRYARV